MRWPCWMVDEVVVVTTVRRRNVAEVAQAPNVVCGMP